MSNNDNIILRIEFTEDDSINQILINKKSTIQNLKLAIKNKLNINCDEQVLINKGEILQNDKLIKDYNITNNNRIILVKEEKDPNTDVQTSDKLLNNDDLNKNTKNSNIIGNNIIKNNDNNKNTNGNNNKNNKNIDNKNEKEQINTSSNNQIKKTTQGNKKVTTKNKKNNNQLNEDSDEENDKFYRNYNKNQNNNNNNQNQKPSIISKFIEGISDITDLAQNALKNPEAIYPLIKNPLFMPFIESDPNMKEILESPENFTKKITKQKKYKNANTFVDSLANILNMFRNTNNNNKFKEKKKDNSDISEFSESDDEFS